MAIGIADQTSPALAHASGDVRHVLIVYENESTQAAAVEIARGLHAGLDQRNPTSFEIYSEYLDNTRFPESGNLTRMATQLSLKYKTVKLDVAITVGPVALQFMLNHRAKIAPGVPVLFGAVGTATAAGQAFPPDVKGIVSKFDVKRTLELARRLQPDAKQAVVMYGSATFDKRWEATAKAELGDHYAGFDIRYLTDLSLQGFASAVAQLPKNTTVLLLTIFEDAEGQKFVPRDAAAKIAPLSAAPVYSVYDTFLDRGVLGGYMNTFEGEGEQLAELVTKEISGDRDLPQATALAAHPIVDWREVQRFGIDPALLPTDAEIRFRAPSLWDQYRAEVLLTITILLLQAATIAALIIQGHRRKNAEAEVATGRLELAHLSRASLLGELSGAFAHELNQPLTSILANAQVGKQLIESGKVSVAELNDILTDIVMDDKRAAEVITQLRRLLMKRDILLEPIEFNQIASATLALAKSELVGRQTKVDLKLAQSDIHILGNVPQLQQIVLNLIINAADATSHLPPPSRLIEVVLGKNARMGELAVSDNGHGLTPENQEEVFKPFVSTKSNGLGLGLAICRSIAAAHGGTLKFDPEYSSGARIVLSLPLAEEGS